MEANLDYAPTVGLEASKKCLKTSTGSVRNDVNV